MLSLTKATLLFCSGLIGLLLANPALACPKAHCVRIGTWNLEWLGSDKRPQPADKKTIHAIAHLIAEELSIDVITLQEINTDLEGSRGREHFSLQPWQQLQSELKSYGYQLRAGNSGYAQHIVLAWRSPISALELPEDMPVPNHYDIDSSCHSTKLRQPLAGLFRADNFNFWVIGVHLKANSAHSSCSLTIRTRQSQDLVEASSRLMTKDADIILIGDFNASHHHQSLQPLSNANFLTLDDKAYRSSASASKSFQSTHPYPHGGEALIDHIMIKQTTLPSWLPDTTTIYMPRYPKEFNDYYSDHRPLWTDFSTDAGSNPAGA